MLMGCPTGQVDEQIESEQHDCNALAAQTGEEPMRAKGKA